MENGIIKKYLFRKENTFPCKIKFSTRKKCHVLSYPNLLQRKDISHGFPSGFPSFSIKNHGKTFAFSMKFSLKKSVSIIFSEKKGECCCFSRTENFMENVSRKITLQVYLVNQFSSKKKLKSFARHHAIMRPCDHFLSLSRHLPSPTFLAAFSTRSLLLLLCPSFLLVSAFVGFLELVLKVLLA